MVIEHLLSVINIIVVETVAQEATANLVYPDAVLLKALLDKGRITRLPVPTTPVDEIINSYPKLGIGKGRGERDTIRLGVVTPGARVIIDDQQAFFVGARFELRPLTLLDLLVELARLPLLSKTLALKIAHATSGRYASVSIKHTLYKLGQVRDDTNHD